MKELHACIYACTCIHVGETERRLEDRLFGISVLELTMTKMHLNLSANI